GGLYRVTVPPVGSGDKTRVEPIVANIGGAHGLLYAFNSLYVMINEASATPNKGKVTGLWRLKDKGDDTFGEPELLRAIKGGGEHGPHGLKLSPDGRSIYFTCGNHTKLPDDLNGLTVADGAIGEDHILPRMWDANGHARGILAPGGYICKTDPDGKKIEYFCGCFRNAYDIAFNAEGELFTYDSDMEWDMGTPWYMPTRVNHCVSGGDYGWRSGQGRWPAYYADCLPSPLPIGPGSPTGTTFGTGAAFPAKYQRAFFMNDWTYGTMYAVLLTPDGATYKAEKTEFVSGKPLPLTDVLIHPDGAMYFTIGGRKTQSALYRVTYEGTESTAAAPILTITKEAQERHELEKLHQPGAGPEAVDKAWPYLSSSDRYLRWAARVAIERQPTHVWAGRAVAEKDPQASLEALMALCHVGNGKVTASIFGEAGDLGKTGKGTLILENYQPKILEALSRIDFKSQDPFHRIAIVRGYDVCFTRFGKPSPEVCETLAAKFDAVYPDSDSMVNRELCQLLVFLDSKKVVAKTIALMATARDDNEAIASDSLLARNLGYGAAAAGVHDSRPNKQQIAYVFALRNATTGWTPELRKQFFAWFPTTSEWRGGNSFKKFIQNARTEAMANFVPAEEKAALEALSTKVEAPAAANYVAPKGPGKAYTIEEVVTLAKTGLKGRNYVQGKAMFSSIMCIACHHFAGEGGSIGPDITGAASRYTMRDLMENIIDPSKVISDQYGTHQIEKKDGTTLIGRIVGEENGTFMVMTNPFAPGDLTKLPAADVKSKKDYPVSMMPPSLINALNQDELLDLLAYIMSAGDSANKAFAK
ncbi:MAG: heme-binding protein, partial [Verrucomicrobiaceae bacterium]|nr:heme-binding protein [Verrucomicrobiaceae bacterium]